MAARQCKTRAAGSGGAALARGSQGAVVSRCVAKPVLLHRTCTQFHVVAMACVKYATETAHYVHSCQMYQITGINSHQVIRLVCSRTRAHLVSTRWQLARSSGSCNKPHMCCRISGGSSAPDILPSASGRGLAFKAMLTLTPVVVRSRSCMQQVHCNQQAAFSSSGACSARISVIPLRIKIDKLLHTCILSAAVVV